MTPPLVLIPGRYSHEAKGHRTPVVSAGRWYADAISRAGAIPLILPPTLDASAIERAVQVVDAMVLLGGGDVCPHSYGQQETQRLYGLDQTLDDFERIAITHAIARDIPLLAICRGHQMLNVVLGGTLIQHLNTTDDHRDTMHTVNVTSESKVATAMQTTSPMVHSFHHQAIQNLADDLEVVAQHEDGTIEAVQHRTASWIVGVQWHPEDTAQDDPHQQGLFAELVQRARKRRASTEQV